MTKTTLHTAFALVPPGAPRRGAFGLLLMLAVVGWPQAAEAQLDPLLLLKRSLPSITTPQYRANVIVNYERSMLIAKPLLEVEIDDELTPAPVFRP